MKILRIVILGFITTVCYSCSTEEDALSPVEPSVDNTADNVYFTHNQWIYSQMNKHYLWRKDLPDSLSCNYDQTPNDFFKGLLSDKDRFSYMLTNPTYNPESRTVLGFSYQTYKDIKNNTASLILYVSDKSVALSDIRRGDWINIISFDTTTLCYSKVTVSDGIFVYDNKVSTLSISSPTQKSTVLLDSIYSNNIGYLCYTEFDDIADLVPVMNKFKEHNIHNLILDLRYNPGGYVKTCKYLANCIAPEIAYGNIFQITKYNDVIAMENIIETGHAELYDNFGFPVTDPDHLKGGHAIIPLNLSKLYVLTSSHTASASEATILCLKPYMEVIQIGETTVGKGVGSYTISDRHYKYAIQPITMQYYNRNENTVPIEGLVPDYYISDGYKISKNDIGDIEEPLLKAALSLINTSTLPAQMSHMSRSNFDNSLTPIGEPSYVTEFKNKYYNESN